MLLILSPRSVRNFAFVLFECSCVNPMAGSAETAHIFVGIRSSERQGDHVVNLFCGSNVAVFQTIATVRFGCQPTCTLCSANPPTWSLNLGALMPMTIGVFLDPLSCSGPARDPLLQCIAAVPDAVPNLEVCRTSRFRTPDSECGWTIPQENRRLFRREENLQISHFEESDSLK